jgi:hypothetical protein
VTFIKQINGSGTLVVAGVEYGPADYLLDAYQNARMTWADGVLNADPAGFAVAMDGMCMASVRLGSGAIVEFAITHWTTGTDQAQVKASGSVPGL